MIWPVIATGVAYNTIDAINNIDASKKNIPVNTTSAGNNLFLIFNFFIFSIYLMFFVLETY